MGCARWGCSNRCRAFPGWHLGRAQARRLRLRPLRRRRIDPDAPGSELDLSTGWLTWGTYADDYFPVVFGRTRDMAGAKVFNERLSAFMPLDLGATPAPTNPVERGLADLWLRTAAPMPMRRGAGSARPSRT